MSDQIDNEELNDLLWKIMMKNDEYPELDRVFAINGTISSTYFDHLTEEEQEDITKRLAIGILTHNAVLKDRHELWSRLPSIKVSGNEKD